MIETARLKLIDFEDAHFEAIKNKDLLKLGQILEVNTPTQWTTFSDMEEAMPYFYDNYKLNGKTWGSFFNTHKKDRELLGTCGFKGSPDTEGVLEIGYEIKESYRTQGLATEAAQGLIDYAKQFPTVKKIRAHTLATANPSVSVLKKLGFIFIGTFHEPNEGDVWRWEISV